MEAENTNVTMGTGKDQDENENSTLRGVKSDVGKADDRDRQRSPVPTVCLTDHEGITISTEDSFVCMSDVTTEEKKSHLPQEIQAESENMENTSIIVNKEREMDIGLPDVQNDQSNNKTTNSQDTSPAHSDADTKCDTCSDEALDTTPKHNQTETLSVDLPYRPQDWDDSLDTLLIRAASPEELVIMEEIFEPRPSTSRDSGINRIGNSASVSPTLQEDKTLSAVLQSAEEKRQQMKFLPRTTQYEKHPLLQVRSDTGLSEFDIMLMEQDPSSEELAGVYPARAFSLDDPVHMQLHHQTAIAGTGGRPCRKLEPRGAHYERNPLFQKNASGLTELEQYLMEKEQEILETSSTSQDVSCASGHSTISTHVTHSTTTAESGIGTISEASLASLHLESSSPVVTTKQTKAADKKRPPVLRAISLCDSTTASYQLQPRVTQYEKHHLLEYKDDTGLSAIDRYLKEKEQEIKGKCSAKCTCKNVSCPKCKGASPRLVTKEVDMMTRIEPKLNNKRVHFQRQDCVEVPPERDKGKGQDGLTQAGVVAEGGSPEDNTCDSGDAQVTEPLLEAGQNTQSANPRDSADTDARERDQAGNKLSQKHKVKKHNSICCTS